MAKKNNPIVIVGGGMVGLTLAIALKQAGVDCLVLEAFPMQKNLQPSFDDRTVALSAASLDIFKQLDLDESLSVYYQSIETIHVSDKGYYGFTRLHAKDYGQEKLGAVIENWRLGTILHDKIKQLGIDLIAPAKVNQITFSETTAQLEFEINEEIKSIETQLVLLADGARSALKEKLNFDSEQVDYDKSALVCNLKTQLTHKNQAFERFTQDGPFALLPLSDDRMSLVWSLPRDKVEHYLNCDENEFYKALKVIFGARLGDFIKVGKRQAFPLMQWQSHNAIKQRCMLIGNSAQALHPIAGQGFNLALRDIYGFSRHIKALLESADFESGMDFGDYQFLKYFVDERRSDRVDTVKSTEALVRLFSSDFLPLVVTRNLAMKSIDRLPLLKKSFARLAMGYKQK